jgi:S1-C subfamily serine protease
MTAVRAPLALLAATALVAAGCGGGSSSSSSPGQAGNSGGNGSSTTRVEVIRSQGKGSGFDPKALYKTESPGVVTIISIFGSGGLGTLLGGNGGGGGDAGVGSGFVLDRTGEIATNAHVVAQESTLKRARDVYVEFSDGNRVKATILGDDPNADVALLRVPTKGLTLRPLPLGDSTKVQVGDPVAAIGSPFGERQSLSVGVISATHRSIASLTDFNIAGALQTDAAINPGNSGGPLVDARGQVVGINQQIKTNSGGGEGVGFAVPIDVVKRSLAMLRDDGRASYAFLGVSSVELYPQLVQHFGLGVEHGAWVQDVTPGGPAAQAGVKGGGGEQEFQAQAFKPGGDVITKVDDQPIRNADDLSAAIAQYRPGESVDVELDRDGTAKHVRIKLGSRPVKAASSGG